VNLDLIPWKDYATISAAMLGAVLGVMNTWNTINQRRVRLRVRPSHAISVPEGGLKFSVEVLNLSSFAVTIVEVGFSLAGRGARKGQRLAITEPELVDGKPWPRRLEARESVSVYCSIRPLAQHAKNLRNAYARTACGEHARGDSPALRQIRKELGT
jgi:hypothetical protein